MKNRRQAGNRFQNWAEKYLTEHDWNVHNQKTVSRAIPMKDKVTMKQTIVWVSQRNDVFGCDLICLKSGERPLFIQATLHSSKKKRFEELSLYPWPWEFVTVELWQKKQNGEVVISRFNGGEFIETGKIIRRKFYRKEEA